MRDSDDIYIDFASKISFLEFIQDEFRKTNISISELKNEISLLTSKKKWNINDLSDYVMNNPKSFIIFQEVFQLLRFTNAQIIHFVFDIEKLNSSNIDTIYEYMIFNIKYDENLRKIYLKMIKDEPNFYDFMNNIESYNKKQLIAIFKQSITKYINKVSKDFEILRNRIVKSSFCDFSIRFSNYLLNNLKLNEILESINIEKFLENKKIPIDTKKLHGDYPKIKLIKILKDNGYLNIDNILDKNSIYTLGNNIKKVLEKNLINNSKIFCTERCIEGIIRTNDKKLKKFDLIIFKNYKPKYLFEVNFYSTEGTKIGINQNEYIDLNNFIKNNYNDFKFYWITDGNYWLTQQGRSRFLNLINYFDIIFNINIFSEYLREGGFE